MFNTFAALGIIALQLGMSILIIGWILKAPFIKHVARHAGLIIAIIFSSATLMSLVYQYGFGYEPCILCWYQRIAIFPISILAWIANLRTSKILQTQILILSGLGFCVALFHVFVEQFPGGIDVCGTDGISCTVRYVYEFGYITIPVMSLTVLGVGLLLTTLAKRYPHA